MAIFRWMNWVGGQAEAPIRGSEEDGEVNLPAAGRLAATGARRYDCVSHLRRLRERRRRAEGKSRKAFFRGSPAASELTRVDAGSLCRSPSRLPSLFAQGKHDELRLRPGSEEDGEVNSPLRGPVDTIVCRTYGA